jgi:multicomponent K+:H+ antiporter subunit A
MSAVGIPLAVGVLFLASVLVPALIRHGRTAVVRATAAAYLVSSFLLVPAALEVARGGVVIIRRPWLDAWGLDLAFRLDGLGLLFAILILGIGLLIVLYATYYMPEKDDLGRFFSFLLAFAGAMLGIVLSENVLLLIVFWEVTSLTSFLLIAYKHGAHDSRIGARMALAVTGGGGLALLAGLLLLGRITGSYELSVILASGDLIRAHPLYPAALTLVLLGAFTKSAQFPFHFWLPNAMAAPTPVSAYLHSATMVKAGVFLLARLYPALSGTELWFILVAGTGAFTLAYAAYVALLKHDLKGLLAYSTVSHLGLITLLLGLDTPMSAVAAVFHIINHATFKASLFMAAGIIDHECGTRDMRRINGLFYRMPITAVLGIVAAGSMAGVPLLNGFLSKEMFFAEAVAYPALGGLNAALPAFATLAGILSVAYSARFVHDVFFNGEPIDLPREPHEPPRWMRAPVEILVALCLAVGLLPQLLVGPLLRIAASPLLPAGLPDYTLAVWHGLDPALMMSAIALVGGLIYYRYRAFLFHLHDTYAPKIASPVAFERVFNFTCRWARRLLDSADNVSLQRYLLLLVLVGTALGGLAWWQSAAPQLLGPLAGTPVDAAALLAFAGLVMGCVGAAVHHRRRFLAIIFLSVVGLIVSLTFIRFSAPDLALTQLSVEVVTIVLLLLALRFLPGESPDEEPRTRQYRDVAIATVAGLGTALLTYAMLTRPFDTISGYFLANAVPGGGGTNVVNVILVDFRGFDTLGEIAVLALAALGAQALLDRLRLRPYARIGAPEADRHPIMLAMLTRPLFPLALVVSFYILLRGHNLPGGGFIAGLITGVALVLQYLAAGIDFARARIPVRHAELFGLGLALAAATGATSLLLGFPFLTSTFGYFDLPLVGKTELASALVFDLGVYLVVVAAVLLILAELGQLSRREIHAPAERVREAA